MTFSGGKTDATRDGYLMSKGALGELIQVSLDKFTRMTLQMPVSEKLDVTRDFQRRVELLEGIN